MKITVKRIILPALVAWAGFGVSYAQSVHRMNIDVKKPGVEISNTMYGLFFEDINFAADGGLYAELLFSSPTKFSTPSHPLQPTHPRSRSETASWFGWSV